MKKQPHELWRESGGDAKRYHELMVQEGHIVQRDPPPPDEPCADCGMRFDLHRLDADKLRETFKSFTGEESVALADLVNHEFRRRPAALPCGWYPGKPLKA